MGLRQALWKRGDMWKEVVDISSVARFCFETGPGVAQIQTLFTANPLPHPGRQGEGNIFAHKAFYKPEQWGMDRKGL